MTTTQSKFAAALEGLLDKTKLFTRKGWAEVLGVTLPTISDWIQDKAIPRADQLSMIVLTLENSSDIPAEPLRAFSDISSLLATEISPHGNIMKPTVHDYITRTANTPKNQDFSWLV